MSRNPKQIFIIDSFTREDLAERLEDHLEFLATLLEDPRTHPTIKEIAVDDERLTDEICQDYADAIKEIYNSDDSEEFRSNAWNSALDQVLDQLGYVKDEKSYVESQILEVKSRIQYNERCATEARAELAALEKLSKLSTEDD